MAPYLANGKVEISGAFMAGVLRPRRLAMRSAGGAGHAACLEVPPSEAPFVLEHTGQAVVGRPTVYEKMTQVPTRSTVSRHRRSN